MHSFRESKLGSVEILDLLNARMCCMIFRSMLKNTLNIYNGKDASVLCVMGLPTYNIRACLMLRWSTNASYCSSGVPLGLHASACCPTSPRLLLDLTVWLQTMA